MKKPAIAIITRTKDREIFLKRAIADILAQTYTDWVWVVVNDGGNTGSFNAVIDQFREPLQGRVQVIQHSQSEGMEASSNDAIKNSDSKYVVIHDDDDTWQAEFLEKTIHFLENKPSQEIRGVVSHSIKVIEEVNDSTITISHREPFNDWLRVVSLYRMAVENSFPPISFVFERAIFAQIGYYDAGLPVLGDWEFNLRFLQKYEIAVLPEALANYHHRLAVKNDAYSNTVLGGAAKHAYYDNLIRNRLLRVDVQSGKVGIGFLVNISSDIEGLRYNLRGLEKDLWVYMGFNKILRKSLRTLRMDRLIRLLKK